MLQMTSEQLKQYSTKDINELIGIITPILAHREALYRRYRRKSDDTMMMSELPGANGKRIAPFEWYIVNMVQGYLGGKAPMYSISPPTDYALQKRGKGFLQRAFTAIGMDKAAEKLDDKQKQEYVKNYSEALDYIQQYNDDAATFTELIHDYTVCAAAYLYVYENQDNEIVYTRLDARQTVAVYDFSTPINLIGLVRHWKEKDPAGREIDVAEVITDESRTLYRDSQMAEQEALKWDDVPGIAFDNPDGIAAFEPALSSITTYEQILNNIANMTQYNDSAKLILKGYTFETTAMITDPNTGKEVPNPARAAEEVAIMKATALTVGQDGDITWLLKDVNYDGLMSVLKNQHELITMLTGVPNMTDEAFSSADNASALGYKLYALDQYCATTDRVFKKGLLRLWEIITGRLNLKGASFDFRDIQIKLQRNIPTDVDKSLSRATSAYSSGLVSQETAINIAALDLDAKEEMERQTAESDANYQENIQRQKESSDVESQNDNQNKERNAIRQKGDEK